VKKRHEDGERNLQDKITKTKGGPNQSPLKRCEPKTWAKFISTKTMKEAAIYAPYICSQAPRTDKNTPENPFRRLKNEGTFFVS
jgi:hypothetical protein